MVQSLSFFTIIVLKSNLRNILNCLFIQTSFPRTLEKNMGDPAVPI